MVLIMLFLAAGLAFVLDQASKKLALARVEGEAPLRVYQDGGPACPQCRNRPRPDTPIELRLSCFGPSPSSGQFF